MNPFEKILDRLEKYEYNDLIEHNSEQCEHCKSIDCEIGMDCIICVMDKAKEIVQEVAREYKKENYFNLEYTVLHKCSKCGGNAQHRVNQRGSWACGCFECKLFKSNYDHQKAIQEWEDYCKEYNNGWIPCSKRLPKYDEEYFKKYNNDKQYIVMCKYSYEPTVAHFSKEKIWYYDDFVKFNDVIAWQTLPEPYQTNGE